MNRRFVTLLVVLTIALQGPTLAYAGVANAKSMPTACADADHAPAHNSGNDTSCCPQGIAPGICCAGGLLLTGLPSAPVTMTAVPVHLVPSVSGSVLFATEHTAPLLRPPIL